MRLTETDYDNAETGCCARLDDAAWDNREITWKDKAFLVDHIRSVLHIPVNFGAVITRAHAAVERAEAYAPEPLALNDEVSPWRSDLYMAVDREVPGCEMVTLSGTFMTRVFVGHYRHVGKWTKEMQAHVRSTGREPKKMYYHYATCPKCAKQFGENKVVLLAQVA